MTTVAVSNVGIVENEPWAGYKCIGNSVVVGRTGEIMLRCRFGNEEDIKVVSIDYLQPHSSLGMQR